MRSSRIGWGVMALFLGMLIPTMHHVLLHWPVSLPTSNVVHRARGMLGALPWMDWAYLALMTVIGLMLVVSGLDQEKADKDKS